MDHPIQYKRDVLYGVTDFISNIGGLLGLCMGFSLLTAIEVVYWFLVRWGILRLKRKAERKRGTRVQVGSSIEMYCIV